MSEMRFCSACGAPPVQREIEHYVRAVCTGCGKILYRNPAPAAGCLVDKDGGVLLARRKFEPWKGLWYIPSGFVEYGDDVEDTARREVLEETGLIVELGPLFGVYSYFDDPRQDGIIILYRATIAGGTLQRGDDASEVAFFAADALPPAEQTAFATHRRALREWCDEADRRQRARLPGRRGRPGRAVRRVRHHDNRGFIYLGTSGDTPAFAVDAIAAWWQSDGHATWPGDHLLVLADAGGSKWLPYPCLERASPSANLRSVRTHRDRLPLPNRMQKMESDRAQIV